MYYRYKEHIPKIDETAFIADTARVIGNVKIGKHSSVWYNSVLRGDLDRIEIGDRTSIQENTVCHMFPGMPLIIGDDVTVGHSVTLHGCTIKNGSLIGMGATVLDGVVVGENSIIGAHSFVPSGKVIPPNSLVLGSPGEVVREITDKDRALLKQSAAGYAQNSIDYQDPEIFEEVTREQCEE